MLLAPHFTLKTHTPKINAILGFKFCPTKNATLTKLTIKDKGLWNLLTQKTSLSLDFLCKTKGNLIILLLHWFARLVLELHLF
jgi:hypothetical protein